MMRECKVLLKDIRLDKNLLFVNDTMILSDERRNKFTCYICMSKFPTARELSKHKSLHSESESGLETEDDLFEEGEIKSKSQKPKSKHSQLTLADGNFTKTRKETAGNVSADKIKKNVLPQNISALETPFKCETCLVYFKTSDDAKLHKQSNIKCKFSCKICKRKFNLLYAFVVHIMQHKSNLEKNQIPAHYAYTCTLCEKVFDDCFQLKRHEIMTHKMKLSNSVPNNSDIPLPSLRYFNKQESTKENPDANDLLSTENVTSELQSNTIINEDSEIICDLCYDVFNSVEELKCHVDFHKQLETNSGTIIIEDDDDEIVEVIEDKRDPHEIKTTIKKSSLHKPSTSTNKYATLTPIYSTPNEPKHKTMDTTASEEGNKPAVSNQILTASIKEMLTPSYEKHSKTILLTNLFEVPALIQANKPQKKASRSSRQSASLANSDNLELRKTGPFSYSFCKGNTTTSSESNETTIAIDSSSKIASDVTPVPAITNAASGNVENVQDNVNPSSNISCNEITPNSNYKFIIKSAPSIVHDTHTVALLPTITSSGVTSNSTTGLILTGSNNEIVSSIQNAPTSVASVLPSSSVANKNFTYVINPTKTSAFSHVSTSSSSINFRDPSTKIAYVIIPHGNNSISIAPTGPVNITTMGAANMSATPRTSSVQSIGNNTVMVPSLQTNTVSFIQPPQPIENSPNAVSTLSSKNDNAANVQIPLITNVTSLHEGSNFNDIHLPVITNITSINSSDSNANSSENVDLLNTSVTTTSGKSSECIALGNTSAATITTTTSSESISSHMIPNPGPSSERDDTTIVIDSDSSRCSNEDESQISQVIKEKSGNDSDSNEASLIIDENAANKSNANDEPKMKFISVRNITELLAPKNTEKEINNDATAGETSTKEKKERKWKFPVKCDGCSVVFQRYRAMRLHNERKHKCVKCEFKCCKVVNLKEHYILEHRIFYCGRCSFLAKNKRKFKEHNSTTHACNTCHGLFAVLSSHICPYKKEKNKDQNKNVDS